MKKIKKEKVLFDDWYNADPKAIEKSEIIANNYRGYSRDATNGIQGCRNCEGKGQEIFQGVWIPCSICFPEP